MIFSFMVFDFLLFLLFYYFNYFCLLRPLSINTPTTLRATCAGKSRVCALCAGTM